MVNLAANPPLPNSNVPSGFIWPGIIGREIIRKLSGEVKRHEHLTGQQGLADGSGTSDVMIYEVQLENGSWCLKTSSRRHYTDSDEGRMALNLLARKKLSLDNLLVDNTILLLQPESENSLWLWTVTPWLKTLRSIMSNAVEQNDEERLSKALEIFAQAAIKTMKLALEKSIILDLHPSNFALSKDETSFYYIDDDIGSGSNLPFIGYSILRRVEEYETWRRAITNYVLVLEDLLVKNLSRSDLERLDLIAALNQITLRSSLSESIRNHLVRILNSIAYTV